MPEMTDDFVEDRTIPGGFWHMRFLDRFVAFATAIKNALIVPDRRPMMADVGKAYAMVRWTIGVVGLGALTVGLLAAAAFGR